MTSLLLLKQLRLAQYPVAYKNNSSVVALAILLDSVRSDHLKSNVSAQLNGLNSHGKGISINSTGRNPDLEDMLKRRKAQAENWRPGPCG